MTDTPNTAATPTEVLVDLLKEDRACATAADSTSTDSTCSSPSSAMTSPPGAMTAEWPPIAVRACLPTVFTATTSAWSSMSRARSRQRQCSTRASGQRGLPVGEAEPVDLAVRREPAAIRAEDQRGVPPVLSLDSLERFEAEPDAL